MRKLPEAAGFPDGAPRCAQGSPVAHCREARSRPRRRGPPPGRRLLPRTARPRWQKLRSPCLAASMAATAIPARSGHRRSPASMPRQLPNPWRKTASGSVQRRGGSRRTSGTGRRGQGDQHPDRFRSWRHGLRRERAGVGVSAGPVGQLSCRRWRCSVSTHGEAVAAGNAGEAMGGAAPPRWSRRTRARPGCRSLPAAVGERGGGLLVRQRGKAGGDLLDALRPEGVRHHDVVARQPRGALLRHQRRCGEVDGLSHPIDAEGLRIAHARSPPTFRWRTR